MRRKIYVTILCSTFCISCLLGQNQTYTNRYDLHFMNYHDTVSIQNWRFSEVSLSSCVIMTPIRNGEHYFHFLHPKGYPFAEKLRVGCEQRILLPVQNEKNGSVSLESKGINIECCELVIRGIDRLENILYADTLRFKSEPLPRKVSCEFPLNNVVLLDISIGAEGFKGEEASFYLLGVDITLGEFSIDMFPLKEYNQRVRLPKDKVIPLNSMEDLEKIKALKEKRIIGLGESVHGSRNISNLFLKLCQHQVLQNRCRLIIYEIPLELSLFCNKYIRDNSFEFEEMHSLGPEFVSLLKWLREYNMHKEDRDKVYILGMDYIYNREKQNSTAATLFDYLVSFNKTVQSQEIDTLLVSLLEESWEKSISFMDKRKVTLEKLLSPVDYQCITHILKLSHSTGSDSNRRIVIRDSIMFENVKYLMSQFCPSNATAIISGHSEHLNLLSCYPVTTLGVSLGAMMRHHYKDDYYSITTLIGTGYLFLPDTKGIRNCWKLEEPPDSSIEQELCEMNEELFFIPVSRDFDKPILSRFIGQTFTKQGFYPYNLYRRHHGLIFFRDAGYKMNKEDKRNFQEGVFKYKRRVNERSDLLKRIKEKMKGLTLGQIAKD